MDCEQWLESKAAEADIAATSGDHRSVFAICRMLGGKASKKEVVAIRDRHGIPATTEFERQEAWEDHFAHVCWRSHL